MGNISLVVMAAGIGSRFGEGIKQLTSFGPSGEIIMDYSIYDAIAAGFDRVVFVIRRDLEQDFREIIGTRIEKHIEVRYAFQETDALPNGRTVPWNRKKPWGTGQAILACRDVVDGPFAVINADDYYGKDAFRQVYAYLSSLQNAADQKGHRMCMAGFVLKNTLSENGGVTRGICRTDQNGFLTGIDETKNILKTKDGRAVVKGADGETELDPENLVSMNFWGYEASFLDELETGFTAFLDDLTEENALSAEYLLPTIVDDLLKRGEAQVSVLKSEDHWFGVTYKEDVPSVKEEFAKLIRQGAYPEKLWSE